MILWPSRRRRAPFIFEKKRKVLPGAIRRDCNTPKREGGRPRLRQKEGSYFLLPPFAFHLKSGCRSGPQGFQNVKEHGALGRPNIGMLPLFRVLATIFVALFFSGVIVRP
jgi:hypothetical protein